MLKIYKKKYQNGLRALVIPMENNPTVSIMAMTSTGSIHENKDNNGISHFLEHLHFKGTKKRLNAKIISEEFDSMGSLNNASTDSEITAYYAKGDSKNFSKMLDLISDMYLNATFPEKEMEKEKGVIIEEINMYEDRPQNQVEELLNSLLYGDQPMGRSIAGTKENIRKMTRADILDYKKKNYVAEKTLVVAVGKVDKEKAFKEIEKKFKDIPVSKGLLAVKTKEKQDKSQVKTKNKKTDQTHLSFGFRAFSYLDNKNSAKVTLLSDILGKSMSSRLFLKLRGEMGVAYYVSANNFTSRDCGYLSIIAGVSNDRLKEVIKEILKECKRIAEEGVDEKELNKVKAIRISCLKMSLESSDGVALDYGYQELLKNETPSLDERIRRIKEVTTKDIQKIAQKIFRNDNLNLAIVGPDLDEKEIKKVCKF
jgi:predicted Zn-dependent peptidase